MITTIQEANIRKGSGDTLKKAEISFQAAISEGRWGLILEWGLSGGLAHE